MDFKEAAKLGSCLSKDYAEDLFRLLVTYESISSSEAASRLNIHIKTVQDLMEDLFSLQILEREEVYEGKRPYFRYHLKVNKITMEIELKSFSGKEKNKDTRLQLKIRERKNAGVRFTTSRSSDYISNVVIWTGEGRNRSERKINLSMPQGRFLFHLPFPTAEFGTVKDIMKKARIDETNMPEIIDIVDVMIEFGAIETL